MDITPGGDANDEDKPQSYVDNNLVGHLKASVTAQNNGRSGERRINKKDRDGFAKSTLLGVRKSTKRDNV